MVNAGAQSDTRQIIQELFDAPVGNFRIDPVMPVRVFDGPYFWTEKSRSAEGKKGPNDASRMDGLHYFVHFCDLLHTNPFVRFWVDERPAHMRDAYSSRIES